MAYNPLQYLTQNQPNTFAMLSQVGRSLGEGRQRQMELARQAKQREVGAGLLKMLGPEGVGAEGFNISKFASQLPYADEFTQKFGQGLIEQEFKPAGAMSATEKRFLEQAKMPGLRLEIEATGDKIKATPVENVEEIERLKRQYDSLVSRYNIAAGNTGLYWGEGNTWDNQLTKDINQKLKVAKGELDLETGEQALKKGEQSMQIAQEGRYDKVLSQWSKVNKKPIEIANTIQAAKSFVGNAKNNPVMAKNLLFAVSRLGSNEAVNESDLSIMVGGNLSDEARAWFDKKFGSGAKVPEKAVEDAIQTLNATEANWMPKFYKAVGAGVTRLKGVDFEGTDEQAEEFLTGYLARKKVNKASLKEEFFGGK